MFGGAHLPRRDVLTGIGAVAAAGATAWYPRLDRTAGRGAAVGGSAQPGEPAQPGQRPNILWLISEDNSPMLGVYGDPVARTPNIDALAAQSIRYRNAYAPSPVCAPTRFSLITGVYPESCGPAHQMRDYALLPSFMRGVPEYLRDAGYYCVNNSKTDYNARIDMAATWDASHGDAHWRNRPADAPFFSVFTIETSHEGKLFDAPLGGISPDAVTVPAYLPDDPVIRRDRAAYYGLLERMDKTVGDRLAELDAAGLAEDTIVFYFADNGGVLPRTKRYCYDDGMRVPLIVRVPQRWAHLAPLGPGTVAEAPVNLVDLPATLLTLADVPLPDHLQGRPFLGEGRDATAVYAFGGRDRMDERYDLTRTVTDGRYRYIRNYAPHRPWGQHLAYAWQQRGYQVWEQAHIDGRLTDGADLFWRTKPAEELYDIQTDPDQMTNLAGDPGYADLRERFHRVLLDHMIDINDNGFIPEGSEAQGWYNSRRPGAYPIGEVLEVADRAIARDKANLEYFTERLTDGNEMIRYWAAQGLLMLGPAAAPAMTTLGARLGRETSQHVQIVIAETLARLGEPEAAVRTLAFLVDTGLTRVRLQALNALTYIGAAAQAALPAIEGAADEPREELLFRASVYLMQMLSGQYRPGSVPPEPVGVNR